MRRNIDIWFRQREDAIVHKTGLKIGTILYSSWGYDQTNIDFFQVTKKNDFSVEITPIRATNVGECGFMQNYVMPVTDGFMGKPSLKIPKGQSIKIDSCSYAWLWDGKKKWESHYA